MKLSWPACRTAFLILALLLNALAPLTASAQDRLRRPASREGGDTPGYLLAGSTTLPEGTLLVCEVVTRVDSKRARPGDRFRARVRVPVVDERGRTLIPIDSLIEGRVEFAQRAQFRRHSGIVEVSFSQLIVDGESYPLNASLAPNVEDDRLRIDEEGNLRGEKSSKKRTVAFIGGGAGAGALIGAFTAGAILGAGVGAGVGVLATFLAKGKEAVAEPGTEIGIELNQPLALRGVAAAATTASNSGNYNTPYEAPRSQSNAYENPPPPGYETPRGTSTTAPRGSVAAAPRGPVAEVPRGAVAEVPRPRPTTPARPAETTPSGKPRPRPTPVPQQAAPVTVPRAAGESQMVNVSNVLAERSTDGKVRVSITGQAPTAGWKLAPEHTVENGILQIKLKGVPPQGMVAQVLSYPTTLVVVADAEREIQRVIVRGPTSSRSTVPIVRGGNSNSGSGSAVKETFSATGTRTSDKLDALVESYAKWNRAWRSSDGRYSFEDARGDSTPEASLLYAFDRLAESARAFRGNVTAERKRELVRELVNGAALVNRILPSVRIPAEFTTQWQGIQREINQLSSGTSPAQN
jgi:hypothetical protein